MSFDDAFPTSIGYQPGTPQNEAAARGRLQRELAYITRKTISLEQVEDTLLTKVSFEGKTALTKKEDRELFLTQRELEKLEEARAVLTDEYDRPLKRFPAEYKPLGDLRHTRQAWRLHKVLAALGIEEHFAFAAGVLGFTTRHLSNLTRAERLAVYGAAKEAASAEDYAGPTSAIERYADRLERLGAHPALQWAQRITGRRIPHLAAMTLRERHEVFQRVQGLHQSGVIGGREPGQAVQGYRAHGVEA